MSKYGFDEKELRKTIVTMIDKDGFHKEVVTYGNEPYSPDDPDGKFEAIAEYSNDSQEPLILACNLPSEKDLHAIGYVYAMDTPYEFNVGQTVAMSDLLPDVRSGTAFTDFAYLNRFNALIFDPSTAIEHLDLSAVKDNYLHYNIYLVRIEIEAEDHVNFTVLDRTNTTSNLPATNP